MATQLEASAAHVHAIGAIVLRYNQLEFSTVFLINSYLPLGSLTEVIFDKLTNHERIDLLLSLAERQERDAAVQDRISVAARHFGICSENRNIIAHLIQTASKHTGPEAIILTRKKSSDKKRDVFYDLSKEELRRVAEEIQATLSYILDLTRYLHSRREAAIGAGKPLPLPKRPLPPCKLTPRPPA